ncbi:NADPH:quinone reductase, partial [Lecanoromycetidae sp. Uapishka_2]
MASSTLPKTMRGILIEKTGGTEVLQYKTDLPVPTPKEGEILVKNDFIGINYIVSSKKNNANPQIIKDTYFRTGLYPSPKPEILGKEASGHIISLGSSVTNFEANDRVVFLCGNGGYAEYTSAPAAKTLKIPKAVSTADACAAILQGLTALTLTEEGHAVKKGDWVLVLAASGGVGTWLCQILRAKGVHTIATVGSEAKVAVAKENGAEIVLVEGPGVVEETIKECTDGNGVIAVFDGVGKSTFDRSLDVLARKGTLVGFGNASGAVEPFLISRLSPKNAKVARPTLFNYITTREEFERYGNELFKLMSEDKFITRIHEGYRLNDVAKAHNDLEGRKTMGKLLLIP